MVMNNELNKGFNNSFNIQQSITFQISKVKKFKLAGKEHE